MSEKSSTPSRRSVLAASAAAAAVSLLPASSIGTAEAGTEDASIRPFTVSFREEDLIDIRRRIAASRWPERELVSDAASRGIWSTPATLGPTQGVQLATMQKLMRYWGT